MSQEETEDRIGGIFLISLVVIGIVLAVSAAVGAKALREIAAQRCLPGALP